MNDGMRMGLASPRVGLGVWLVSSLIIVLGCQYGLEMHLADGSTFEDLRFELFDDKSSSGIKIESVYVYQCSDIREHGTYPGAAVALWAATTEPGISEASALTGATLRYGESGHGLVSMVGPIQLTKPGCFVVRAYAWDYRNTVRGASLGFKVAENGTLSEMKDSTLRKLFT